MGPELKTLEWDFLYPDRLIIWRLKTQRELKHYLSSRLRKRVDQALIQISTIQKFSALIKVLLKGALYLKSWNARFARRFTFNFSL